MNLEIVLRIYRAPSGQWSGKIFDGDEEVAGFAGCESPEEVEELAGDSSGYVFDKVEIV